MEIQTAMASESSHGMCFDAMVSHLESMIVSGVYPPGSRLPTLREFCEQFSLRLTSARRGMLLLEKKGLVEIRPGSGAYVKKHRVRADKKARIAVFVPPGSLEERYLAHALAGARDEAEKQSAELLIQFLNDRDPNAEKVIARMPECDALLLIGCYDAVVEKLPPSIPVAGLEMHRGYNGQLSAISLDPVNAAELACKYFQARKIRHVQILDWKTPVHRFRGKVFSDLWLEYGGSCEQQLVPYGAPVFRDESIGILSASGSVLDGHIDAYRQDHPFTSLEKFAILSLDGRAHYISTANPVDSLWLDWREAGRIAFAECYRRWLEPGSPARRIYLNVFLRRFC